MIVSKHAFKRFRERFDYLCEKPEYINDRIYYLFKRANLIPTEELDDEIISLDLDSLYYLNIEHGIIFVIREDTIVTLYARQKEDAQLLNRGPEYKLKYLGKEIQKRDLEIMQLKKANSEVKGLRAQLSNAIRAKNDIVAAYQKTIKAKIPDEWAARLKPYMEYYFHV